MDSVEGKVQTVSVDYILDLSEKTTTVASMDPAAWKKSVETLNSKAGSFQLALDSIVKTINSRVPVPAPAREEDKEIVKCTYCNNNEAKSKLIKLDCKSGHMIHGECFKK